MSIDQAAASPVASWRTTGAQSSRSSRSDEAPPWPVPPFSVLAGVSPGGARPAGSAEGVEGKAADGVRGRGSLAVAAGSDPSVGGAGAILLAFLPGEPTRAGAGEGAISLRRERV